MEITERKITALNEVLSAYETYRGLKKSRLEELLDGFKNSGKLTADVHTNILTAVCEYKQYLLRILSRSERVRVVLDNKTAVRKQDKNLSLADFDFSPLGELPDLG